MTMSTMTTVERVADALGIRTDLNLPVAQRAADLERRVDLALRKEARVDKLDALRRSRDIELARNSAERQAIWDRYAVQADLLSTHPTEVGA
jgi:hypothetical protein